MPFGEEINGTGGRTTGLGYGSDAIRQKFTGYERDNESSLDYAKARMFGYSLGRFTSPDPLMASAAIDDPQTFNRYTYVSNNPLKFVDPTGMSAEKSNNGGCPEGKICDENGKVVEVKDGTVITGSVGVVDVVAPPSAPVEAPPIKIPGNTPIIETPW